MELNKKVAACWLQRKTLIIICSREGAESNDYFMVVLQPVHLLINIQTHRQTDWEGDRRTSMIYLGDSWVYYYWAQLLNKPNYMEIQVY